MSDWRSTDVVGSVSKVKLNKRTAPVRANTQYGTLIFAADKTEVGVTKGVPHQGWVQVTTVGSRKRYETLVAMKITGADGADDTVLPDA